MAIRTRRPSIFQHPPAFNKATQSLYLFPAIIFAFVIVIFFLYTKLTQAAVGTTSVPVEYYFLSMTFGLAILFMDEARKWAVRIYPRGFLAKIAR